MDLIARDMDFGFGWDLGLGLVLYSGDWLWGRIQRTWTCLEKIMKGIIKKRQERHLINLFCFDVFSYKESTRKI